MAYQMDEDLKKGMKQEKRHAENNVPLFLITLYLHVLHPIIPAFRLNFSGFCPII